MKKATLLTVSLILCLSAFSQNEKPGKKFHLGFIATPGLGWVTSDSKNLSGSGLKAGIGLGVYGDYFFSENYAFSLEILHSTQGFKVNANNIIAYDSATSSLMNYSDVSINYRMRSFQIPLTLKLRTNEIGYWRYYGQIGIAPAFTYKPVKADFSKNVFGDPDETKGRFVNEDDNDFIYEHPSLTDDQRSKILEEDNVLGFRLPILLGGGAEWNLSANTSVLMGLRYEYGLINMMKATDAVATRNTLNLVAGIRF